MMKKLCKFSLQVVLIVAVTLAFGLAGSSLAWANNGNKFVPGELLIQVKPGVSKGKIDTLLKAHGAATSGEIETIRIRKINVSDHALEKVKGALEKNPNISFVENNYLAEAADVPNDERYPSQWHLPKISAPDGWDLNTGAETVPIAIIDSGVDPTHPDLRDKLIAGYNFLGNNTDTQDVRGHGTAVAGSAAAMTDNGTGIAGVAWNNPIMPLVVLNADDYATYYDIARAINYAADNGVRIMNISIGGSSASSTLQNAVNYAWNKGAVIFACAHNYSTETPYYPAACANVVAVSATTSSDTRASFSNYGDWVDISAPGVAILTTNRGGGYGSWSGTSFSSPITAGVAALILSANPSLTNAQVVDILTQTADDLGTTGFDKYFGYGRVNAFQSILAAMGSAPEPDTTDPSVTITSPQDDAAVNGGITVSVSATDEGGIDHVELYVDGDLLASDNTLPYSFSLDTTAYANGSHDLLAVAYDTAGNQGQSGFITVSVGNEAFGDTVAPNVAITSIQGGAVISGGITVSVSATDEGGVDRVELYIGGKLLATDIASPYAFYWDTAAYANGSYDLLAIAYDTAGNEGRSGLITVSVDNEIFKDTEPPDVFITSPGDGDTLPSRTTIQASASDNSGISRMELYVDGKLLAVKYKSALSWNWNVRKETAGLHTILVKAVDTAGNEGINTISVSK
jgi:subtilisin family serine protease